MNAERPVILDTSFIRRFTKTGRLDLLAAYANGVVTRRVLGEHSTVVPAAEHRGFVEACDKIPFTIHAWFDLVASGRIQLDHQNLSNTDASLIAASQKTGYTLLTADDGIYAACLELGVPAKSFVAALLDLAGAGWFDGQQLLNFMQEVESRSGYSFSRDARRLLERWAQEH